ncbi:MAG: hypothetical protein PHS34_08220 [Candidatus Omnitrophica bacterium]|jgi:predicted transcriptional regulator|nr:hypothetical protein [Sulfurimonas sp.]MDD5551229.1 hypothetical protein [Candidatus Omnitrophota bacterium]
MISKGTEKIKKLKPIEVKILTIIEEYKKKTGRDIWQSRVAYELDTKRQNIAYHLKNLKESGYIKIEVISSIMQYISIKNKRWRREIGR